MTKSAATGKAARRIVLRNTRRTRLRLSGTVAALVEARRRARGRRLDEASSLRCRAGALTLGDHVLVMVREAPCRAARLEELRKRHEEIELPRPQRFAELFQELPERLRVPLAAAALRFRRLLACRCCSGG